MAERAAAKKYVVAAGFAMLSLWVLYQVGSAITNGFIYTLAVKHNAHQIVFRDSPYLLIGTLLFYLLIGPGLGALYVYINFISGRRRSSPLASPPQQELFADFSRRYETPPRKPDDLPL